MISVTVNLSQKQSHTINTVVKTAGTVIGEQSRDYQDWRDLVFSLRKEQRKFAKVAKKTSNKDILNLEMDIEAVYIQLARQLPTLKEVEGMTQ